MILPVTAYGHPTLKKVGEEITNDYPDLDKLIDDMYETMYHTVGVGLAAHQINRAIRLFVIDPSPYKNEMPELEGMKKVFINAYITKTDGESVGFEEGCLSVPGINENVMRPSIIYVSYYDQDFNYHEDVRFEGMLARIIQHEYDHIDGKVFIERLPNIRRMLLKGKLRDISAGKVNVAYRMLFPKKKNKR